MYLSVGQFAIIYLNFAFFEDDIGDQDKISPVLSYLGLDIPGFCINRLFGV